MTGKWQIVEKSLTDVIRHGQLYDTQREAERAAAEMANRLADNDLTEIYAAEAAA